MKKIYKVVVNYGKWCDDLGMCIHNTNFEFFSTKKAALAFIDAREAEGCFANYESASAKVFVMECSYNGRFWESNTPIVDFKFSTNKKAMFI